MKESGIKIKVSGRLVFIYFISRQLECKIKKLTE